MLHFARASIDEELAVAIYEHDGTPEGCFPYPDAPGVLRRLRAAGARIAIVSDIHFDLRPLFAHYGLLECVDAFIHSYEHGIQKPDPAIFRLALDALGAEPEEALMVGDRAERDGGSVLAGVAALILPPVAPGAVRGLRAAERFLA
jgi:HAD superfamily hydrolase (TIGR01509 family)